MQPMLPRQPIPMGFNPACELALPANARSASFNGKPLALPRPDPSRIVVFGDTGCRIRRAQLQDCNDPAKWPFETIAGAAAAARPNLVVHVGDYLYREDPCPPNAQAQCGGTPSGDNWRTWNADFFKPAAKLLAAAPWIFARGNHEDCQRSWRGWFYYLDPRPWNGTCAKTTPPYSVELGKFQAIDFDSSAVNENQSSPEQVAEYSSQLASIHARNAWLVDHHPFWGVRAGAANQPPLAETITLQQAWEKAAPKGIDVVLSGHTHLFEVLSYGERHRASAALAESRDLSKSGAPGSVGPQVFEDSRPLQIVAGDGGTKLSDPVPNQVNGMDVHGVMVAESQNRQVFGYTLFSRNGPAWQMTLTSLDRRPLVTCRIQGREATCSGQVVKVSSGKQSGSGAPVHGSD
jgi:hypothetical protein